MTSSIIKVPTKASCSKDENYANYALQFGSNEFTEFYFGKMKLSDHDRNEFHYEVAFYLYELNISSSVPRYQIIHHCLENNLKLRSPVFNKEMIEKHSFAFETALISHFKSQTSISNVQWKSIDISSLNNQEKLDLIVHSNNDLTESEVNTKVYTYDSLKEKFGHYSKKFRVH